MMETMAYPFKSLIVLVFCCWRAVLVHASSGLNESNITLQPSSDTLAFDWEQFESRIDQYVASVLDRMDVQITPNSLEEVPNIPSILSAFPSAEDLGSLVGPADDAVHVLHIPSFGNWTREGWGLRFRGTAYKQHNVSERVLLRLARIFGLGPFLEDLGFPEKAHLRKMLRGLFMVKQRDVNLTFQLEPQPEEQSPDFETEGSAIPRAMDLRVDAPSPTNLEGDYDFTSPLSGAWDKKNNEILLSGQSTDHIQVLGVSTNRTDAGHPLAYLVPSSGHTVVSDIDDVLRVSTIFQPKEGLQNLLTRPFYPWMNMPEVFGRWALLPDMHFHYLSTSPTQFAESYMDFVFSKYPAGSFDGRMINIADIPTTLSIRRFLLEKVLQTFPNRKFTLVGDSTNYDIMEDYPRLALKYPDAVQCILIRNTSATDHGHWLPYNTKWFRDLEESSYMFFRVPDDIIGLDISEGECYNACPTECHLWMAGISHLAHGLVFGVDINGNQMWSYCSRGLALSKADAWVVKNNIRSLAECLSIIITEGVMDSRYWKENPRTLTVLAP